MKSDLLFAYIVLLLTWIFMLVVYMHHEAKIDYVRDTQRIIINTQQDIIQKLECKDLSFPEQQTEFKL